MSLEPGEDPEDISLSLDEESQDSEDEGLALLDEDDSLADGLAMDSDSASAPDSLANQEYSILLTGVDPNSGRLFFPGKDTSEVNDILNDPKVKAFFPPSLEFLWSVKPLGTSQAGDEIFELYPIKRGRNGKAPLEGDVITNANNDISQDGRGYEISMQMN